MSNFNSSNQGNIIYLFSFSRLSSDGLGSGIKIFD
jgi:hypothetical protein